MRAAGLPVPRPLLAGERRRFGFLTDGCYLVQAVPGAMDFVPYLARHFPGGRPRAVRLALLGRLARLARRMHDAGFSHGDLHSGNLLVTGPPEDPRLYLIDLHTVRIHPRRGVRRATRRGNLAKLLHSLLTVTSAGDRLRILAEYEGDAPVLGERRAVARRLSARIRALERIRLASRTRRCLRDSSSFVPGPIGPYRGFRRREVDPEEIRADLEAHAKCMAAGGREVLKDSARSAISRPPGGDRRIVVKETRVRGPLDLLKNAFRRPRGRAAWRNGNGLLVRQVGAARPLALAESGRWPIRRGSWLVMEDVGDRTRLDLFVLRRYAGELTPSRRREKLLLVRAFALFLRDLHRRGIYHGDLKAVNVFVEYPEGGEPRFVLVDYDRVRFGRRVGRRRRVKNLTQIAASVAVLVTRTDRLRFFRTWAPDEDAIRGEKQYNRRVRSALAHKIVVRMAPIE
jgi:tRNA A-37 threonylcarbamoyl transferase component Bud32